MSKNRLHIIFWLFISIIFVLFCYFRIKPIHFQTVPYTYDQGRDFLKTEEIVRYKNLTFIGPTTGVQGLHHGAWWYYFLSIVFLIFNGWPEGFYYGMFFLALASTALFFLFIKKEFDQVTAAIFLLLVTVSPYFIKISFFPGNNILTPVAILFFLYALYHVFKNGSGRELLMLGLSLGFIFETEVPFGLFLLPAFFILAIFYKDLRKHALNWRHISLFMGGLLFPFLPRLLFELKNNFVEITSAIHFFKTSAPTNPISLMQAAIDRFELFQTYYYGIFFENSTAVGSAILAILSIAMIAGFSRMPKHHQKILSFLFFTIILVFTFSLANKNNFFWENYLEGIQYIFVFMILIVLHNITTKFRHDSYLKAYPMYVAPYVIAGVCTIAALTKLGTDLVNRRPIPTIGLRADIHTVEHIYQKVDHKDFCVKVYTPPIVPYTYNYLFSYYSKIKGYKWPAPDFVKNECWYIIDQEPYLERLTQWRKEHIPANYKKIKSDTMPNQTVVELWRKS